MLFSISAFNLYHIRVQKYRNSYIIGSLTNVLKIISHSNIEIKYDDIEKQITLLYFCVINNIIVIKAVSY